MMFSTGPERDFEHAQLLMQEYSFDLGRFKASELVAIWHERLQAEPSWIRAAVLEALYLGRYKAFSVEQILQGWKRRSHPVRHFNSEFERAVFGPIDPTVSQSVTLTARSSAEPMPDQTNGQPAVAAQREPLGTTAIAATTDTVPLPFPTQAEVQLQERLTSEMGVNSDLTSSVETDNKMDEVTPDYAASLFSQPEPIQQFTPAPEPSEFYQRLQAVARRSES